MATFDQPIPMRHAPQEMVPRGVVVAMFSLMIGTLAMVAFAQWTGAPNVGVLQEAPVVAERSLWISGERSGPYALHDADGMLVASSTDDKAGFIGVVGLVVNRERATLGVTGDAPIRVVRRDNGHVAVIDDATGNVIELIGYGADNVAAFANLLN